MGFIESLTSVKNFKHAKEKNIGKDWFGAEQCRVVVEDLNIDNKIDISLSENANFTNINIYWEDVFGESYKERNKLFGYYGTNYQQMIYDKQNEILTIIDSEGRKIEVYVN